MECYKIMTSIAANTMNSQCEVVRKKPNTKNACNMTLQKDS